MNKYIFGQTYLKFEVAMTASKISDTIDMIFYFQTAKVANPTILLVFSAVCIFLSQYTVTMTAVEIIARRNVNSGKKLNAR